MRCLPLVFLIFLFSFQALGSSIEVGTRAGVIWQPLGKQVRRVPVQLKGYIPKSAIAHQIATPFALIGIGMVAANTCPNSLLNQVGVALGGAAAFSLGSLATIQPLILTAESEDLEKVTLRLGGFFSPVLAHFIKKFLWEGNGFGVRLPPLDIVLNKNGRVTGMRVSYMNWSPIRDSGAFDAWEQDYEEQLQEASYMVLDGKVIPFSSVLDLVIRPN